MPRKLFTSLLNPSLKVTEDQLETDVNILNMDRAILAMNRRSFLGGLAATGALAAAGSTALVPQAEAQGTATPGLLNVLNFALNLEYLEANFYIAASGGTPLSATDTNSANATAKVPYVAPVGLPTGLVLDPEVQALAAALAADERNHIEQLRAAIIAKGGTPIVEPAIDYTANGTIKVTTQAQFLALARQFTAVGNSAYAGAAYSLYGDDSLLTAAAQILGAEGQHLGAVNYQCVLKGVTSAAVDTLDTPPSSGNFFTITPTTTPFYPSQPIVPTTPTPTPVPTVLAPTGAALGIGRTPQDVLGIVYGVTTAAMNQPPSSGVAKGGFFPAGVNGSITTT